ncbi:site-2 protease family protein [Candidatus Woesearchaeota archaeon]|jgi:membrane-associated protease RseP (regulator of RpoE activity)|nr:site-2 protease family protein [Candidatus Woesearchaeota archaeon]MBT5397380.1 site-2 protease family protein [Candidatus Woesearchaeota archaeon]MBT6367774.1 site-2 protease family protein [Candidatus Woesearchaeota archaeon]MBT7762780.1 site-2 protease family protein [Candidatus Woesearchaeota archaeon]
MIESILSFIIKYKIIFLFYLAIIVILFIKRKKIETQAKIIILYRMKWGLKWMDKYSKKFREWIILLGYIGVGAGFVGLVFISYILIKNLYDLIVSPTAVSGVSLVLPGINVPGLGVLPFWYWLIAIFIIAIVHEFSHGIVARAHDIKVKNTGIVFFGPIIGAFVEPDEKNLQKREDIKQYSVLAAGSFSNILLAIGAFILLMVVFTPLQNSMVEPAGFTFDAYFGEPSPFEQAGIVTGTVITGINGIPTMGFEEFSDELITHKPGDTITVNTAEKDYTVALTENPDNIKKPLIGIQSIKNDVDVKPRYEAGFLSTVYYGIDWITGFLRWLFLLSLGIGLFNLLPLPIVDGGRMAQVFLHKLRGQEKGEKSYRKISMFFLFILLLNLFFPLIVKLF